MEILSGVLVLAAVLLIVFAIVRKLIGWAFVGLLLIGGAAIVWFVLR